MFRYKFTLEKNGDYSIFRITYQNGKIIQNKIPFLAPKTEIEATSLCFVLNECSRLDWNKIGRV